MGMVGFRDVLVVAPAASFHPTPHHHHGEPLLPNADHPIIPLLTAAPCLVDDPHDAATRAKPVHHLWQPQLQQLPPPPPFASNPSPSPNPNPNSALSYLKKPVPMLDAAGILSGGVGGRASGSGTSTCQDCGNQAKKDCSHSRCRTCCKSRAFDCSTHVKSTWVPAARRRERQLSTAGATAAGSSASTSAPKKLRLIPSQTTNATTSHTSTSNTTPPRSFDTSSSRQDASFRESLPGHVRAPAVFKCVRVTSIDDGEDQYAYHAMVKIGGHVFQGFLYDHGLDDGQGDQASDSHNDNTTGNNSSGIPNISELHLGGGGGGSGPSSDLYGSAPGVVGGLIEGGTAFGNTIN